MVTEAAEQDVQRTSLDQAVSSSFFLDCALAHTCLTLGGGKGSGIDDDMTQI